MNPSNPKGMKTLDNHIQAKRNNSKHMGPLAVPYFAKQNSN